MVGNVALRGFRPSALIDPRRGCILDLLLFLAIELVTSAISDVSLVFKELLLGGLSVVFGTLSAILSVRWLHELFTSISQILMRRRSALIEPTHGGIQL